MGDLNEAGLEVSLAHAYHHMNFAWNVRNKTTKEADRNFDRDEKFPRPTGRFCARSTRVMLCAVKRNMAFA